MRIAVLSDIHGNYEALEAVLAHLAHRCCDCIISLGDNIGYGPDPELVVQRLLAEGVESVAGNHERALYHEDAYAGLNFQAQENNCVTRALLSHRSREYCRLLPLSLQRESCFFVHGFPPNSVDRYIFEVPVEEQISYLATTSARISFVGHTHRLQLGTLLEGELIHGQLEEGAVVLRSDLRYFVNGGSVGQPRGHDGRAGYLIWDSKRSTLEVIRVSYDWQRTVAKLEKLGWPAAYALRLGKVESGL